MKYSTRKILEFFPMLKDKIPNHDSILLEEQTLNELNETEQVFLKMIWFFESPSKNNFNLYDLLKYIDKDWLSFALECIVTFFYKDNYFESKPDFSIITSDTEYLNQTNFTNFLNEHKNAHGKNFSRAMLNSYLNRGIIPEPDLELAGTKYWLKETCEEYLSSLSDSLHEQEISNNKFDATDVFFKQRSLNLLEELLIEYKKSNQQNSLSDSIIITAKKIIDDEREKTKNNL